jgi:hypothetical protein
MEFSITPSPQPEIFVQKYDAAHYPKFHDVFETDSVLGALNQDPKEAVWAVVIENDSDRDLTALRYRYISTLEDGKEQNHTHSSDSYMVDVFRPVLKRADRALITRSTQVHESVIDHVRGGGGLIGGGVRGARPLDRVVQLRFEIDFILFEDGEIAGPDKNKYAFELQSRKPAAEFVAKQIRLAEAEGRDVTPVLSALAEVPHLRDDFLADCTQDCARDFLRDMHDDRRRAMRLRHLENRPTLPKFYRREK